MNSTETETETEPESAKMEEIIEAVCFCIGNTTLGMLNHYEYEDDNQCWVIELCPAPFDRGDAGDMCAFDLFDVSLFLLSDSLKDIGVTDIDMVCDRNGVYIDGVVLERDFILTIYFDPQDSKARGRLNQDGSWTEYATPIDRSRPRSTGRRHGQSN